MPTFQTVMTYQPAVAVAGQLGDNGFHDVLGKFAFASTPAGVLVVWHAGDADNLVRTPAATGEVTGTNTLGVALYDAAAPNNPYLAGDVITVVRKGRVWVTVEEAVTLASAPFVRFASGSFTQLGAFRASADTATAVALPGARFLTSQPTIGGLALLEVNLSA